MVSLRLVLSLALTGLATPAWADCANILPRDDEATATERRIVPRDLIELRDIGMPDPSYYFLPSPLAISPDGRLIAFVINRGDLASNGYCRALVVIAASGPARPRVVDRGGQLITASDIKRGLFVDTGFPDLVVPAWSPDGRWIAYLKRVDGVTQLWRAHADGSGASAVTGSPVDVERWAWADDGHDLIFASRPGIEAARRAIDAEAQRGYLYDARVRPNPGPRPTLREADVPPRLFRIDPNGGLVRVATRADEEHFPPEISGGGSSDITVIGNDGRKAGTERETPAPLSPSRIWVADPAGKRVRCPAETCGDGIVNLWWAEDDALVFLRREGWAHGRMAIYRWVPGHDRPRRVLSSSNWLIGCTYRSAHLYCTSENSTSPRRIVSIGIANRTVTTLFDPNPGFSRVKLGKVERLTWRNDIGLPAWGDLVLPPGYVAGTRLPLVIVQYHSDGFLRGGTGDDHPIFLLAAKGFAVLSIERPPFFGAALPNLKSIDEIIAAMTKDWAERKSLLSSVLAGVDQAVARGIVDPHRVGITGLSDGVSTVEFGLINSRRFAAASISTCCEDPKTVMTYGGIAWADWNRAVRNYPLASEDGAEFWKPIALSLNADRIDAPILMQLADSEYLLSLETFTALREQKRPVEMYVFPGEHHTKEQPLHRLAIYERDLDWFSFWLQGQESPDPAKRSQYERWRAMRDMRELARRSPAPAAAKP